MKIYTKTGDQGTTALFGGSRVSKNHLRIEAYGTVDETNAFVGEALTRALQSEKLVNIGPILQQIQNMLFVLGADLATAIKAKTQVPRIQPGHIKNLETLIDKFDAQLPPLKSFILPGGCPTASALHVARTVCRRAERHTVALREREALNDHTIAFLNRLSDLLFVMARWANAQSGVKDVAWKG